MPTTFATTQPSLAGATLYAVLSRDGTALATVALAEAPAGTFAGTVPSGIAGTVLVTAYRQLGAAPDPAADFAVGGLVLAVASVVVPGGGRSPSGRILRRSLTVTRRTWGQDAARGRTVTAEATATLAGTLQQARADRVPEQLRAAATIDAMALFGTDPQVKADDLVADGTTVMVVKAPAVDELGTGGYWVVYGARKA